MPEWWQNYLLLRASPTFSEVGTARAGGEQPHWRRRAGVDISSMLAGSPQVISDKCWNGRNGERFLGVSYPFHFAAIPTDIHTTPSTGGVTVLLRGAWGKATLTVNRPSHIFIVNSGNWFQLGQGRGRKFFCPSRYETCIRNDSLWLLQTASN